MFRSLSRWRRFVSTLQSAEGFLKSSLGIGPAKRRCEVRLDRYRRQFRLEALEPRVLLCYGTTDDPLDSQAQLVAFLRRKLEDESLPGSFSDAQPLAPLAAGEAFVPIAEASPGGGAGAGGLDAVEARPAQPAAAPLFVRVGDATATEGQALVFTVSLSAPAAETVQVAYLLADGTATAESGDYQRLRGQVSFAPGQTTQTISVPTADDDCQEGDEHFWLVLHKPRGARIADRGGTGVIIDNDTPPKIYISNVQVEAGETATFFVSLSNPYREAVSVHYATVADGPAAMYQFEPVWGTLSFQPGEVAARVAVPTLPAAKNSTGGSFSVVLSDPQNAQLDKSAGTASFTDKPQRSQFPAARPTGLETSQGQAALGDGGQMGALSVQTPTLSVYLPDFSSQVTEGQSAIVVFELSHSVDYDVAIGFETAPGTADPTDYYHSEGTVVIPAGSSIEWLWLSTAHDELDEDDEHFWLLIKDGGYFSAPSSLCIPIIDDDAEPVVSIYDDAVNEGSNYGYSPTASLLVALSAPSGKDVLVDWRTWPGTADQYDFSGGSGQLHFLPQWDPWLWVEIPVSNDPYYEPEPEQFFVELWAFQHCSPGDPWAVCTIYDDDLPGEPPDAVDDLAFTGKECSVTIYVLQNDVGSALTITAVTQGARGNVSCYSGSEIIYTPHVGFVSGEDSFQYTVQDNYGREDTATVTITLVEVSGYILEWKQPDDSWAVVPEGEASWSHDQLRWSVQFAPRDPPIVAAVDWLMKDWAERDNPAVPWESFGTSVSYAPLEVNPGVGDWAIMPVVHFAAMAGQTAFCAAPAEPRNEVIARIQSVEWVPYSGPQKDAGALMPAGVGVRFFPDAPTPPPGGQPQAGFRQKVDLLVSVLPRKAGISVSLYAFDVDDPSRADPSEPSDIDTEPGDNFGGLGVIFVHTASDDNGQIRIHTLITNTNPGDNYRVAVAARGVNLLHVKPLAKTQRSELYYDLDEDDVRAGDQEITLEEETEAIPGLRVSPLLTVWRTLHVEVDSMGPVQGNIVVTRVKNVFAVPGEPEQVWVELETPLPAGEENRFVPGTLLDLDSDASYEILSNTLSDVRIRLGSNAQPEQGAEIALRDDDLLHDGDDVPNLAYSSLLALSRAMDEACVEVIFDVGSWEGNVPFVANIDPNAPGTLANMHAHWQSKGLNANNFWVAYLVNAFQHSRDLDFDPNSGGFTRGGAFLAGGAYIYHETIVDEAHVKGWDWTRTEANVVLHEVGHLVAGYDDPAEQITEWNVFGGAPMAEPRYTTELLRMIRRAAKPWPE